MGLPISADTAWKSWVQSTYGAGTISISDGVLRCSAAAGSRAIVGKRITVNPGETVTFTVIARRISGTGDTSPRIGIDYPVDGDLVNSVAIASDDWAEYSVSYSVPLAAAQPMAVRIVCGSWLALDGDAEYLLPRIEIKNPVYGAPRVVACALIKLASSTPTIHEGYVNCGIKEVTYSTEHGLIVTIDPVMTMAGGIPVVGTGPLFWVGLTPDGPGNLIAKVGGYIRDTGKVSIKLFDTTTGASVGHASENPIYIWFKAEL